MKKLRLGLVVNLAARRYGSVKIIMHELLGAVSAQTPTPSTQNTPAVSFPPTLATHEHELLRSKNAVSSFSKNGARFCVFQDGIPPLMRL